MATPAKKRIGPAGAAKAPAAARTPTEPQSAAPDDLAAPVRRRQQASKSPGPFAAEVVARTAKDAKNKAAKLKKPPKLKKPKPVKHGFTMPKEEYQLIELLKQRAAASGHKVRKNDLLRAGILALAGMSDARLFAAIAVVPQINFGGAGTGDAPVAGPRGKKTGGAA